MSIRAGPSQPHTLRYLYFLYNFFIFPLCFLYVLSRNDRHSGSRAVFDHNISDMDRSRNRNCTDFFHARKNLIFRNVILCLYGNHGNLAILYMNRGGHHTGRIGDFLLCIDFTTLTGISGYRDLLTFSILFHLRTNHDFF